MAEPLIGLWTRPAGVVHRFSLHCGGAWLTAGRGIRLTRAHVVIDRNAPELEQFAASELGRYLVECFDAEVSIRNETDISAEVVFLVGSPATNPAVQMAASRRPFPEVSEQGLVLRRLTYGGRRAFIVGGGSPAATLWAVYELAQRWGVRFLIHGDVIPRRQSLWLPNVNEVMEPEFPIRQWRVVNDFACGPESWGIADYRPVLDQLAKLKFNRIYVALYAYQPFLHFKCRGVTRSSGRLWFGFRYPITDDMIGRDLFDDRGEFWNPDLPVDANYQQLAAAGQEHVRNIIQYAESRGMQCVMLVYTVEFPGEFGAVLGDFQYSRAQWGDMTVVPGLSIAADDPALADLAGATIRAAIDTYPEVDKIVLDMPEQRQWVLGYERAWKALDDRYGIERIETLQSVLAEAETRTIYPGGAARAVNEVKGDIVGLYFYDRLIRDTDAVKGSRRPDIKFVYDSVSEELISVLKAIVESDSETQNFVDYTASNILRRPGVLAKFPDPSLPATLIFTLHDDNVGVLPQLTAGSLHEIVTDMKRHGWAGFTTRYWMIGDHDRTISYLSRTSWERAITPDDVSRDQVTRVCGRSCVQDMLAVFKEAEAATVILEQHALGVTFPVPGMIMRQWTEEPFPSELIEVRDCYSRALLAARSARRKTADSGIDYVDYWVGRLEFGIGYLKAAELVRDAASADAAGRRDDALGAANAALALARSAIESQVKVSRDQSDRGAVAVLNEHVYRPLRSKLEDL